MDACRHLVPMSLSSYHHHQGEGRRKLWESLMAGVLSCKLMWQNSKEEVHHLHRSWRQPSSFLFLDTQPQQNTVLCHVGGCLEKDCDCVPLVLFVHVPLVSADGIPGNVVWIVNENRSTRLKSPSLNVYIIIGLKTLGSKISIQGTKPKFGKYVVSSGARLSSLK